MTNASYTSNNPKQSKQSRLLHFIGLAGKTNVAPDYKPSYFVPKLAVGGIVCLLLAALTTCTPAPANAQPAQIAQPTKIEMLAWYSAGNIENRLRECSLIGGIVTSFVSSVKQGVSEKDVVTMHEHALQSMSELKKEMYNDAFYTALEMQKQGASAETIKHFVVKQCSH